MRSFRFEPVRWMTVVLAVLSTVDGIDAALAQAGQPHILPDKVHAYVLMGIALLTVVLGQLARGKVTPTAAPRSDTGERLVPASMRVTR